MYSPLFEPKAQVSLKSAYDTLRVVNESLDEAEINAHRLSEIWGTYHFPESGHVDGYEPSDDGASDYAPDYTTFDSEDAQEWLRHANDTGLVSTKEKAAEELKFWSDLRDSRRVLQEELRSSINESSRKSLRSLHILDLPEEILFRVFEYLDLYIDFGRRAYNADGGDIKNCRLVCQMFNNIGSRFYLRGISVGFNLSSISRLEEIANHPIISKGVRGVDVEVAFFEPELADDIVPFIHFNTEELENATEDVQLTLALRREDTSHEDDYHCFEDDGVFEDDGGFDGGGFDGGGFYDDDEDDGYDEEVSEPEDGYDDDVVVEEMRAISGAWDRISGAEGAPPDSSEDRQHWTLLQTAHEAYRSLYRTQEQLFSSGEFDRRVAAAMAKMSGARKVYFIDGPRCWSRAPFYKSSDVHSAAYKTVLRPLNHHDASEHGFTPRLISTLSTLPTALGQAGCCLDAITMDLTYLPRPSDLVPSPEARQLLASSPALEQLTRLIVSFPDWSEEREQGRESLAQLVALCSRASGLRELEIDLLDIDPGALDGRLPFEVGGLITSQKWPRLSKLTLLNVDFHLSDLQRFVAQHRETPLELALRRTHLLSGTWIEALDLLRGASFKSVGLTSPGGGEIPGLDSYARSKAFNITPGSLYSNAERYIRGQEDVNPLRDDFVDPDSMPAPWEMSAGDDGDDFDYPDIPDW